MTAENLAPYTKAALRRFLEVFPEIDAIQFRMHDESGLKPSEVQPFWHDVFSDIKQTHPNLRLDLRAAIEERQLVVMYQPIVKLDTRHIESVEALLRWRVPGGLLMPDDFLPAVAHTPAMRALTAWVIDAACTQARRWPSWTVSVNIAPSDVARPELVDIVSAALRRHHLPASA